MPEADRNDGRAGFSWKTTDAIKKYEIGEKPLIL